MESLATVPRKINPEKEARLRGARRSWHSRFCFGLAALALVPASAQASPPGWTPAQAQQALLERVQLVLVDRAQPDRPTFTFRIERIRPGQLRPVGPAVHGKWSAFTFVGTVHELRIDAQIRVALTIRPAGAATFAVVSFHGPRGNPFQPSFPIRAAFYYPWFPRNWTQLGVSPFSRYPPSLGYYSTTSPAVVRAQRKAMGYGAIEAGIYSWWGQGSEEDRRFSLFLASTRQTRFRWAVYYEPEGYGNPGVARIRSDLLYIRDRYGQSPAFLRVNGRLVIFVYGDAADNCGRLAAWQEANVIDAYVVLKIFTGYESCSVQPDGWHQYEPARAEYPLLPYAYTISPGFWNATDAAPRLERDLGRWRADIAGMIASKASFQLISSFNEWGEGTAVESATDWATPSGYGAYLDALHENP